MKKILNSNYSIAIFYYMLPLLCQKYFVKTLIFFFWNTNNKKKGLDVYFSFFS